jgi:hypothetical protein
VTLDALNLVLGITTLLVPVVLLATALVLLLRLAAAGELRRGLMYIVLLPARRATLLRLVAVTIVLFLLAGVVNGLTLLGLLSELPSDLAIAITDIGASVMLLLVLFRGLAFTTLSPAERSILAKDSSSLAALGFIQALQESDQ